MSELNEKGKFVDAGASVHTHRSDGKDNVARKFVSTCRVFCFASKKPIAVF